MKLSIKIFLSIFLIIFNFNNASGKCALGLYFFSGEIKDKHNEKNISDAKIYIFIDNDEYSFPGEFESTTSYSAISDINGRFSLKTYFNTFSGGSLWGDQCDYEPQIVEVLVIGGNYHAGKFKYKIGDLKSLKENDDSKSFALPPILMLALKNDQICTTSHSSGRE